MTTPADQDFEGYQREEASLQKRCKIPFYILSISLLPIFTRTSVDKVVDKKDEAFVTVYGCNLYYRREFWLRIHGDVYSRVSSCSPRDAPSLRSSRHAFYLNSGASFESG